MEWMHTVMQQAQQQMQDTRLLLYGHIVGYDPARHAVRVLIPQYRAQDDQPLETSWIPLGSMMVGNQFGIQYAPHGGATPDQPNLGEQCQVMIFQRSTGLMAVAHLSFNDTMQPPGGGNNQDDEEEGGGQQPQGGAQEDPQGLNRLEPGELVIRHESGSFIKFYQDGNIQIYSANHMKLIAEQNLEATINQGDLTATVTEGNAQLTVTQGNINVHAEQGNIDVTADNGNVDIEAMIGDVFIESTAGQIAVMTQEGDIVVETTNGSVHVGAGQEVNVIADGIINLVAPAINAGLTVAMVQQLCNVTFLALFNAHTHMAPGGVTGPPTTPAVPGVDTTTEFWAS